MDTLFLILQARSKFWHPAPYRSGHKMCRIAGAAGRAGWLQFEEPGVLLFSKCCSKQVIKRARCSLLRLLHNYQTPAILDLDEEDEDGKQNH